MNLSVIIPTYRRPDLLRRVLSSIEEADRPASLLEVIVVENGGHAGAADICAQFSSCLPITYLYEEQSGVGNARNRGARHCEGEILIFFDDDIRVYRNTLVAYDSAIKQHGESVFYGGPLVPDYEVPPEEWLVDFLPPSARGFTLGPDKIIVSEPCLLGGNFAVPRSLFDRTGGFDEVGPAGNENGGTGNEKRLQMKLIQEGLPGLFVPDALVGHYVPPERSSSRFIRRRRWRRGYGFGELYANGGERHRSFLGGPLWWWASIFQHFVRYIRSALTLKPRAERFDHLLSVIEALGWINGYLKRSR